MKTLAWLLLVGGICNILLTQHSAAAFKIFDLRRPKRQVQPVDAAAAPAVPVPASGAAASPAPAAAAVPAAAPIAADPAATSALANGTVPAITSPSNGTITASDGSDPCLGTDMTKCVNKIKEQIAQTQELLKSISSEISTSHGQATSNDPSQAPLASPSGLAVGAPTIAPQAANPASAVPAAAAAASPPAAAASPPAAVPAARRKRQAPVAPAAPAAAAPAAAAPAAAAPAAAAPAAAIATPAATQAAAPGAVPGAVPAAAVAPTAANTTVPAADTGDNSTLPLAQDTIAQLRKDQMKTDLEGMVLVVKVPGVSKLEIGQEVDGNLNPLNSNDTLTTLADAGNTTSAAAGTNTTATAPATAVGTVGNPVNTGASGAAVAPAVAAAAPVPGAPAATAPGAAPAVADPTAAQPAAPAPPAQPAVSISAT